MSELSNVKIGPGLGREPLDGGPPPSSPPPQSTQSTHPGFEGLDATQAYVLGTDGNLWLENGPWGTVPPSRQHVDGNVSNRRKTTPPPGDITVPPTSIVYNHSLDLGADIGNIAGPISLTITSDGSYNFSGRLNNSGKLPYTVNVAVGIESAKGSLFLFTASKFIDANLPWDNNNASWNTSGNNAAIKGVWGDLQAHTTVNYQSSNSLDLAAIVSSLESAFQDVQKVETVAAAF